MKLLREGVYLSEHSSSLILFSFYYLNENELIVYKTYNGFKGVPMIVSKTKLDKFIEFLRSVGLTYLGEL